MYRSGADSEYIRRFGRWRSSAFAIYLHFDEKILRNLPTCLMHCEGLTVQLKERAGFPQKITCGKQGEVISAARYKSSNRDSEGKSPNLVAGEKRTGGKRAKRNSTHPPSGPDSKDVIDDSATNLLYQEKQMWGILSHPDYADANGGFGGLMTKVALTYVVQWKTFADEAYAAKNFRCAKIRAMEDRWNRADLFRNPNRHSSARSFSVGMRCVQRV